MIIAIQKLRMLKNHTPYDFYGFVTLSVLNGCLTEKRTYCCKTVATNPSGSPSVIIIQGPAAPAVTTTTTPKQDTIVIKVSG